MALTRSFRQTDLSKHERTSRYSKLHSELLRGQVAMVVQEGSAPVGQDHAAAVKRGRLPRHGGIHRPVLQELREQKRRKRPKM